MAQFHPGDKVLHKNAKDDKNVGIVMERPREVPHS